MVIRFLCLYFTFILYHLTGKLS